VDVTLGLLLSGGMPSLYLPRRVVFKLLGYPVGSVTFFVLPQAASLIVEISELVAGKFDDGERKVVSDSVDVVG